MSPPARRALGDRWPAATPVANVETRVPHARTAPRPRVRLEPSSPGELAAPEEARGATPADLATAVDAVSATVAESVTVTQPVVPADAVGVSEPTVRDDLASAESAITAEPSMAAAAPDAPAARDGAARRPRAIAARSRSSVSSPPAPRPRARVSARAASEDRPPASEASRGAEPLPPGPGAEPMAATEAARSEPPPVPTPAVEVAPLESEPPPGEGLYAVEETIDRFLDVASASPADRDARRRAAEAFARVAAHLGGEGETAPEQAGAREMLRPGYYVRQWGRGGLRERVDDVDELGLDPATEARYRPMFDMLYRRWFRAVARGLENVPAKGRVLLVANHGGALPWDGLMLRTAFRLEHPAQRDVRWLAEDFVAHAPFLGAFTNRVGAVRACPENAERLLAQERAVAVFPEGAQGSGKPFRDRYALQRFGRGGYVRLALRMRAPIVPTAIVGSEEAHPILFRASTIAKLVGMPYLPVTPTFPWLGPLGLVPLPSRWVILCGDPIDLDHADPDDPIAVARENDRVRGAVQDLVRRALALRGNPF